jgi:hypothetical protein
MLFCQVPPFGDVPKGSAVIDGTFKEQELFSKAEQHL